MIGGLPKGAVLVIGVEFWERFSFYGMLSILALFLTASPAAGGFGWPAARALALVGAYSGAMYAFPALGGYLADRVLGRRRAVTLGASCMVLGQILLAASSAPPHLAAPPRREALRRIGLLLVLAALLCTFSVGWFQLFGSWLLFIEHQVDRAAGPFIIPVPWFTSMNAAVVIVLAPAMAALWVRLGARNRHLDILQKYLFALSTVTLGNGLMYLCARNASPTDPASVGLPIVSLSLLGIGELVAWTATYGMVSRAAPSGYASVTMGAWYLLTLGLGGYLSGLTGHLVDVWGFATTFAAITAIMGVGCVIAVAVRGPMARLATLAHVTL